MNENTNDSSLESLTLNSNNKSIINNNEKEKSRIIKIIAELLKSICEEGKSNKDDTLLLVKPFISKKIPSISIIDYIERLLKYSKVSDNLFIIALIYIDRISRKHKINLNYYNIHKIILASFICTIKFYEDECFPMNFYAKMGGITLKEINSLEYEFLNLIDFKLFVDNDLFEKYNNNLRSLDFDEEDDFDIYDDSLDG
jgi:hypothetical protein